MSAIAAETPSLFRIFWPPLRVSQTRTPSTPPLPPRLTPTACHGAASLFRAAARAEQIHAANHARVIGILGGQAEAEIHPVEVKSTLENLKAALNGEQYEIDTMYPGFLQEATERKNTAAIRTFHGALEAEKTHARLYAEAIALLAAGKKDSWIGEARDFYVCPICGYTSETEEEHERCPVCNCPWERFEIIR